MNADKRGVLAKSTPRSSVCICGQFSWKVEASTIPTAQSRYDAEADVLYLIAEEGLVSRSIEVAPGITIEYGEGENIVGVEILRASRVLADRVVASLHAKQVGVL